MHKTSLSSHANEPLTAPHLATTFGEALTPLEFGRLLFAAPALRKQPRGNGQPVLVLPGMGAGNASTSIMRHYLNWLGYAVEGWRLGRNTGSVQHSVHLVANQVAQMHRLHGQAINIVGWSLGGIIAREVARENSAMVKQVITLGSPVVGGPKYTRFGDSYRRRGIDLDALEARIQQREQRPIPVPITSIYSKRDGIVSWQASIDRNSENADQVEVSATHLGMGIAPEVLIILAQKLAQH